MICLARLHSPTFRAFVNAISCSFWEKEEFLWCKQTLAPLTVPTFHECTNTIKDRRSRAMARYAWHHVRAWYEIVWWWWWRWWWLHHMVLQYECSCVGRRLRLFHFFISFSLFLIECGSIVSKSMYSLLNWINRYKHMVITHSIHSRKWMLYICFDFYTHSLSAHALTPQKKAVRTKNCFSRLQRASTLLSSTGGKLVSVKKRDGRIWW